MGKILLITALFLSTVLTCSVFAQNSQDALLFNSANQAYRNEKFEKAEKLYRKALLGKRENSNLYYNLGNACFKQKKIGWARLYYEKAIKLVPGNESTKKNLAIVISVIEDKIPAEKSSFVSTVFEKILNSFSISGWVYLLDIFYFTLCGILGFKFFYKKSVPYFSAALWSNILAISVIVVMLCCNVYKGRVSHGIIIENEVEVKSAPQSKYPTIFKLHMGTKIVIREKREKWVFIKFSDKFNGWIPAKDIESI